MVVLRIDCVRKDVTVFSYCNFDMLKLILIFFGRNVTEEVGTSFFRIT